MGRWLIRFYWQFPNLDAPRFQTIDQTLVYAHIMLDVGSPVVAEAISYRTGEHILCRRLTWPGDGWWYMGGIRIDEFEPYLTLRRNLE